MPSLLDQALLDRLNHADDLLQTLPDVLTDARIVSQFVEEAADYWATDDALSIGDVQRDGDTLRTTGTISFTDTPWEACGAAVRAQHKAIPVLIEIDLAAGEVTLRAAS